MKLSNIMARFKGFLRKKEMTMSEMNEHVHVVKLYNKKVVCTCGFEQEFLLGSEAKHIAYVHAQFQLNGRVENHQDEYPDGFSTD